MEATVTFNRKTLGPHNGKRVKNTLKTYIFTNVIKPSMAPKEIAEELGVDLRSVYRYIRTIKEVEADVFKDSGEPDRP